MADTIPMYSTLLTWPQADMNSVAGTQTKVFHGPGSWSDLESVKHLIPTNDAMSSIWRAGREAFFFEKSLHNAPQKMIRLMNDVLNETVYHGTYRSWQSQPDIDILAHPEDKRVDKQTIDWSDLLHELAEARKNRLDSCQEKFLCTRYALEESVILEVITSGPAPLAQWIQGRQEYYNTIGVLLLRQIDGQSQAPNMTQICLRLAEEVPVGRRISVMGKVNEDTVRLCMITPHSVAWTDEGEVQRSLGTVERARRRAEDEAALVGAMEIQLT